MPIKINTFSLLALNLARPHSVAYKRHKQARKGLIMMGVATIYFLHGRLRLRLLLASVI